MNGDRTHKAVKLTPLAGVLRRQPSDCHSIRSYSSIKCQQKESNLPLSVYSRAQSQTTILASRNYACIEFSSSCLHDFSWLRTECRTRDSNPHAFYGAAPSTLCVYLFPPDRLILYLTYVFRGKYLVLYKYIFLLSVLVLLPRNHI